MKEKDKYSIQRIKKTTDDSGQRGIRFENKAEKETKGVVDALTDTVGDDLETLGITIGSESSEYIDVSVSGKNVNITLLSPNAKISSLLSYIKTHSLHIGNLKNISSITYDVAAAT